MDSHNNLPYVMDNTPFLQDRIGTPMSSTFGTPMMNDFGTPLLMDNNNEMNMMEQPLFGDDLTGSIHANPLIASSSNLGSHFNNNTNHSRSMSMHQNHDYDSMDSTPLLTFNSLTMNLNNEQGEPLISPVLDFHNLNGQVPPLFSPQISHPLNTPIDNLLYSPFIGNSNSNPYSQFFTPLLDSNVISQNFYSNITYTPLIDTLSMPNDLNQLFSPYFGNLQSPALLHSNITYQDPLIFSTPKTDLLDTPFIKPPPAPTPLIGINNNEQALLPEFHTSLFTNSTSKLETPLVQGSCKQIDTLLGLTGLSSFNGEEFNQSDPKDDQEPSRDEHNLMEEKPLIESMSQKGQDFYNASLFENPTTLKLTHDCIAKLSPTSSTKSSKSKNIARNGKEPKRYKCPTENCGLAFARLYNLKTHQATHNPNRVKPFPCTQCARRFDRKHDLGRHLTTVHNKDKGYECRGCGRTFSRRDGLTRHLEVPGYCHSQSTFDPKSS